MIIFNLFFHSDIRTGQMADITVIDQTGEDALGIVFPQLLQIIIGREHEGPLTQGPFVQDLKQLGTCVVRDVF